MSLIETLSNKDKAMMETYIDRYACEDSGRTASIEHLLRFWDKAKSEYLYQMFGNQLSVTKQITFKQDIDELSEEISRAIIHNPEANSFISEWRHKFGWLRFGPNDDIDEDVKAKLYNLGDWTALASNVYQGETFIVPFKDGTQFKVQHGAKITKAMGKIVKGLGMNEERFEAFRIACSQGLNQKVLKGNLTLSIHPMDYMTMSDNENDWSSCMSWRESGCYRQGTVEMMNSPMVVVAYLTSEDEHLTCGGYTWNSKKWRELLIVTPDMICNILGYPYRNENLSKAAIAMLKELAEQNCGFSYKNDKPVIWYQRETFSPFEGSAIYIYTETYNMYNDFSDRPHFGYFNENVTGEMTIYYSGESECMCCGQANPEIDEEGYLVGNCCYEVEYCAICGERLCSDEDYWVDDLHICRYCAEDRVCTDIHGNEHYDENLHKVTLIGENNRGRCDNVYVYYNDWNWKTLKKYFSKMYSFKPSVWDYDRYYVKISDLTDKGVDIFCETLGYEDREELTEMFNNRWYSDRDTINLDKCKVYTPETENLWW